MSARLLAIALDFFASALVACPGYTSTFLYGSVGGVRAASLFVHVRTRMAAAGRGRFLDGPSSGRRRRFVVRHVGRDARSLRIRGRVVVGLDRAWWRTHCWWWWWEQDQQEVRVPRNARLEVMCGCVVVCGGGGGDSSFELTVLGVSAVMVDELFAYLCMCARVVVRQANPIARNGFRTDQS